MKPKLASSECGKFRPVDLFAVLAVLGLAVVLILPMLAKSKRISKKLGCDNNLKQVGLAVRLWGSDNGDRFPSQVPASEGGAQEDVELGMVTRYFQVMSNELGTPKIVACPYDLERKATTNFGILTSSNLSYFAVPEATESVADMWLTGDRNLAVNEVAIKPGLFSMPAKPALNWTTQLHNKEGYICLSDGSVRQYNDKQLRQSATNALRAHYDATTNAAFRLVVP